MLTESTHLQEISTVNYAIVQLYRETIINHALELLDAYGLADMTMRRVASSLDVAAGALYWHIANKQELITAVATKILTPVLVLDDESSPQEFCTKLRATLLRYRDGAELVHAASSQPHSPLWSQLCELLARCIQQELVNEGLLPHNAPGTPDAPGPHIADETAAEISAATTSALHLIFGASIMEQSAKQLLEATQSAHKTRLPAGAAAKPPGGPNSTGATFRRVTDDVPRGITVLLAGLKTRLNNANSDVNNQKGSLP